MKRSYGWIILIIIFSLAAIFWLEKSARDSQYPRSGDYAEKLDINSKKIEVEIAATEEKRALGLSRRESLCQNCAMLFIFEKRGNYAFWMKDMLFDIDIVWISGNKIVGIDKNISHERGSAEIRRPDAPVDKVLEINAGENDRLNLKVGDKIYF